MMASMIAERIEECMAMSHAELDEFLRDAELAHRALEADMAAAAAVVEARMQFLDDGHYAMSSYLKAHLNCSGAEANRLRRLAKTVNEHSEVGDALAAGRIGVGQADRLAKANSHPQAKARFGEFVDVLVDHGEHFSMKEFEVIVGRFESNADPDGNPPDDNDANATVSAGAHGVNAKVTGGTALQGAETKAVFDIAVEAEFQIDVAARRAEFGDAASDHPLLRTAAQRRFAAEYAIHLAYVSAPPGSVRPEPIVNIVFSAGLAGRAPWQRTVSHLTARCSPAANGESTTATT